MVGVAVASIAEGQNLNFAIPSSYLAALLKHMGEPRSFSSEKELQGDGGWDARVLGTKNTDGVAGVAFLWEDGSIAKYTYGELSDDKVTRLKRRHFSFTFQNRLQTAVTDVHFVVVFFGSDGEVVDSFEGLTCPGRTILPMLAKRQVEAYWSPLDAGGSSICSSNVRKSAPICTLIGCSEIRGTLWKEWRRRRDSERPQGLILRKLFILRSSKSSKNSRITESGYTAGTRTRASVCRYAERRRYNVMPGVISPLGSGSCTEVQSA